MHVIVRYFDICLTCRYFGYVVIPLIYSKTTICGFRASPGNEVGSFEFLNFPVYFTLYAPQQSISIKKGIEVFIEVFLLYTEALHEAESDIKFVELYTLYSKNIPPYLCFWKAHTLNFCIIIQSVFLFLYRIL